MNGLSDGITMVKTVKVQEWESFPKEAGKTLAGVFLPEDPAIRDAVTKLSRYKKLHIEELRHGIRVRATSWVGRITLGDLQISVEPKITGMPLLRLLRYAYGLRKLDLHGKSSYDVESLSFLDLLIHQLAAETEELMRRGLRRAYVRQDAYLAVPRGRLDVQRYVRDAATVTTALPCSFHPRTEDTLLNQVLLAGVRLGSRLTADPMLRATLSSRCRTLEEEISTVRLDWSLLQRVRQGMSRLTHAYDSTLALIEMLMGAQGVSLEGEANSIAVPSFLFDMNRFFQALLSRFLSENLTGFTVKDEHILRGMMTYDSQHNPRHQSSPAPRPDFVVLQADKIVAVLDAKYRDLWETPLPREMLYQLAIYALSQRERRVATILYPTLNASATEAHVVINDAVEGRRTGRVILRPVNLHLFEPMLTDPSRTKERHTFASRLVFGERSDTKGGLEP